MNVAVVVLDTLRKDFFDAHFGWLPGRSYERAYSTANWTVPAHASLFTGRYASEVGTHSKHATLDCAEPTVAERLAAAGYETRAFSANMQIMDHTRFDRGFDEFHVPDPVEYVVDDELFDWSKFYHETDLTGIRKHAAALAECIDADARTVASIIDGVRTLYAGTGTIGVEFGGLIEARRTIEGMEFGSDEFLFVNLMETHGPLRVPNEYRTVPEPPLLDSVGSLNTEGVPERNAPAYEDCVRYLSDAYREFFGLLREEFDYVITLSDHGEQLGENGGWGHEHGVHPALTHIPLTVSGGDFNGESRAPVNLLDVHRTILELTGVDGDSRGRSLRDPPEERPLLAEYHGLTRWSESTLRDEGYDEATVEKYDEPLAGCVMPSGCYGRETVRGFDTHGECDDDRPRERLEELVSELDVRDTADRREISDETRERLALLGYGDSAHS